MDPQPANQSRHQDGFVGLFDILGYQAFLIKNRPETAAGQVIATLLKLDEELPQKTMTLLGLGNSEAIAEMFAKIRWLIFSDSILLTLDLSEVTIPEERGLYWIFFLTQCSSLWRSTFDFGLPLRGAITKGPYLVQKACFAGMPIVDAHNLASDLDCAGVVIAPSVINWAKTDTPNDLAPGVLHFDYLLSTKSKGFIENATLNVAFIPGEHGKRWDGDIHQLVHESFWAHNKTIGPGVPQKIENTVRLLRFLKMKWPDGFASTPKT